MTDKSYVSMEQHVCDVCGKVFDTGSILLDRRLKDSMGRYTLTGHSLCPEHKKLYDDGYVALIAIDPGKSKAGAGANVRVKPQDAYRTGEIAHVRRTVCASLFNIPIAPDCPMVFCDPEVITKLQAMMPKEGETA